MARWPSETFVGASAAACALTAISLLAAGSVVAGAGRHEPAIGISAQLEDRYPQQRTAFPDDVLGLADLIYASPAGFRPLTLDLYLPAQRRMPLPTIVFVHGGGWTGGHSRQAGAFENWPRVLASIAARGYVVASVNYRLSSEAVSPAAERDIKSAIAWLRANATRHAIDISRFGIWGASAGGQLAALAGTSCDVADLAPDSLTTRESVCVQAVATWYGVLDFAPLVTDANLTPPVARYLGCVDRTCSEGQVETGESDPVHRCFRPAFSPGAWCARPDCSRHAIHCISRRVAVGRSALTTARDRRRGSQLHRCHARRHARRESSGTGSHHRLLRLHTAAEDLRSPLRRDTQRELSALRAQRSLAGAGPSRRGGTVATSSRRINLLITQA